MLLVLCILHLFYQTLVIFDNVCLSRESFIYIYA